MSALRSARRNYLNATHAAIESGSHDFFDLLELEDKIIDTYYFELLNPELTRSGNWYSRGGGIGRRGEAALEAKIANSKLFPGTAAAVGSAIIELGDWLLLFSSHGPALEKYRDARDLLIAGGVSAEEIDSILAPDIPVLLPAVSSSGAYSSRPEDYRGYIDVVIDLTRYGRRKRIEILDRSPGTTDDIEKRLKKYLGQSRFRPRFVNGEPARSDRSAMRFYFDY